MSRLPVVALVGRPNVGKSTLFNRLTRSRAALVADRPGLTRDRHYGRARLGEFPYIVIDTGGFEPVAKQMFPPRRRPPAPPTLCLSCASLARVLPVPASGSGLPTMAPAA